MQNSHRRAVIRPCNDDRNPSFPPSPSMQELVSGSESIRESTNGEWTVWKMPPPHDAICILHRGKYRQYME